jgi:preprotein translocase subunit SecG
MHTLTHTLAAGLGWEVWLMAVAFAIVCVFMMLVILIQKPKGGGLSGAFGGGAGGGSAGAVVGARVGDVLTVVTVVCFLLFLGLAMGLTWTTSPSPDDADEADPAAQVEDGAGAAGTSDDDPAD